MKEVLLSASVPVWDRAQELSTTLSGIAGHGYNISLRDFDGGLDAVNKADIVIVIHGKPVPELNSFIDRSRELAPDVPMIVVDVPRSGQVIAQYVMDGAAGCLLVGDGVEDLARALESIEIERPYLPPAVQATLLEEFVTVHREFVRTFGSHHNGALGVNHSCGLEVLTDREREVLELVEQGLSNRQISERLYLEVGTVKNHVHSILSKLEVPDRAAAGSYHRHARTFMSAT